MRTKGIGPQGLGIKGNNGYIIGSPAKCWQGYARVPGTKKNAKGSCKKNKPMKKLKSYWNKLMYWLMFKNYNE